MRLHRNEDPLPSPRMVLVRDSSSGFPAGGAILVAGHGPRRSRGQPENIGRLGGVRRLTFDGELADPIDSPRPILGPHKTVDHHNKWLFCP